MKKVALFLLGFVVIFSSVGFTGVSSASAYNTNSSYYTVRNRDFEKGYEYGYRDGYSKGYKRGYDNGYYKGYYGNDYRVPGRSRKNSYSYSSRKKDYCYDYYRHTYRICGDVRDDYYYY